MTGRVSTKLAGGGLFAGGLGIISLASDAVMSTFDKFGVVDRRATAIGFCVALIGAIANVYGTHVFAQDWFKQGGWRWAKELAAGAVSAAVIVLAVGLVYLTRPDSEFEVGELSGDDPFSHRVLISGGNGFRYYITFTPSGSLEAEVQLRGGGQQILGTLQESGTQVMEGILVGDTTWTTVMRYIDGEGKYLLFIDSAEPERLAFGAQESSRSFDIGRTRAGYVFSVGRRQNVYIQAHAADDNDPNPGLVLRDSDGTPIDNVPAGQNLERPGGNDEFIFTAVPEGDYVLEVFGEPAQRYRIVLRDSVPGSPTANPPEPSRGRVEVPDVSRDPEQVAVQRLTDAGFVVQSYPVCSGTLANEGAAVGTTRQVVQAGTGSVTGEQEIVGLDGVVVDELPATTRLDVKVFNGLPC